MTLEGATTLQPAAAWLDALAVAAPDPVAAFRGIDVRAFLSVRREVRRRAGAGSALAIVPQLGAVAAALAEIVAQLPVAAFREPGGEADWNVAQAIGHTASARAGLALAASLAAGGRGPSRARPVVPGVPGGPHADRADLLRRLAQSQRVIERSARAIAGHELDPCPLEHPLVGRLRCGEWLLFAGVHDLMHLEQLHALRARHAAEPGRSS
ncbi:MAG TPA: DinB family protein [Candidatus Limnocylindrales bacterium]